MGQFEINKKLNLIHFQPKGHLSTKEVFSFLNDVVNHQDYEVDMLELIDLSEVDKWSLQYDDVQAIISTEITKGEKAKRVKKMAVYAPSDIGFGVARMYQSIANSYGMNLFISRSFDKIMDHLDLQKEQDPVYINSRLNH